MVLFKNGINKVKNGLFSSKIQILLLLDVFVRYWELLLKRNFNLILLLSIESQEKQLVLLHL
jgi:hypothetical protein